ncbi:hypothetical protein ABZV31_24260 [Streptomyces sp. NPDC005202]|uniref:hypothetical protein n=1 Tax=Streptomyces sp. NPDC005202 TaxID=3157021 RepID=UPI0033A14E1C
MRRTTLHRTSVAAAAATFLLAGCATQNDGGASGSGASVSPTPTTTRQGCATRAELTAADSGRTLCLTAGGQVRLTLDGTKDRPWTPVKATGNVLRAANAGIVILPGDAVAAFDAVAPGTAQLTSSRPLCATGPDRISCKGIQEWTVTVKVTKP